MASALPDARLDQLPQSQEHFIEHRPDGPVFLHQDKRHKVEQLKSSPRHFYLFLEDGRAVEYERQPGRPHVFGDSASVQKTTGFALVVALSVPTLIFLRLMVSVIGHCNAYFGDPKQLPAIVEIIIAEDPLPVLTTYLFLLTVKRINSNKSAKRLDLELARAASANIDGFLTAFDQRKIYEWHAIKDGLLRRAAQPLAD